jgi:hypothetical protein
MQFSHVGFRERDLTIQILSIQIAWIECPCSGFEDVLALPLIELFLRGEVRNQVVLLFGREGRVAVLRCEERHLAARFRVRRRVSASTASSILPAA